MKTLLFLLISTHILYASFWQECEGIITVNKLNTIGTTTKATLEVHTHTFECKGHSETLYNVVSRDVPLVSATGTTPKLHKHYRVSYKYSDGATLLPHLPNFSREWRLIKRVHFVPAKPKEDLDSTQRPPKVPSEGIDLHADIKAWENTHKDKK